MEIMIQGRTLEEGGVVSGSENSDGRAGEIGDAIAIILWRQTRGRGWKSTQPIPEWRL